jgi:hypothetical protein
MVSNFGKGTHASRFLFKVRQTQAGGPAQISTRANGHGFLVWGIEKQGVIGQVLKAQAIKLPVPKKHHHHHHHHRTGSVHSRGASTGTRVRP